MVIILQQYGTMRTISCDYRAGKTGIYGKLTYNGCRLRTIDYF